MDKRMMMVGVAVALAGCQDMVRPELTPVGANVGKGAAMIATPLMVPNPPKPAAGSLWVPGSKQFFKDSRAREVGDIVTIVVSEEASAKTEAKTETDRTHNQESGISNLLNLEGKLISRGIPLGVDNLVDTDSNRSFNGEGKTDRKDSLQASIAAVVMQVLPNGLLVVQGEREVVVNYEKQVLKIQGIIRPEDISAQNTIPSAKIAEARIAYAGKGTVDESQTPQYGVRALDKILPF